MTPLIIFARRTLLAIVAAVFAMSAAQPAGALASNAVSPGTQVGSSAAAPHEPAASPTRASGAQSGSTASSPPPPNLEPLSAHDCTGVLGKKVVGPNHEELGLLTDVLVDAQGRPRAAVIDFGGFLGVGSRKIAVDWRLLKLTPGSSEWQISANLTRAEIQGAPEYKPDAPAEKMVGAPLEPTTSPKTAK